MSRILVTTDDGATLVEVTQYGEGHARAECLDVRCRWTTDPDRRDTLHDVIEEAAIHVDFHH